MTEYLCYAAGQRLITFLWVNNSLWPLAKQTVINRSRLCYWISIRTVQLTVATVSATCTWWGLHLREVTKFLCKTKMSCYLDNCYMPKLAPTQLHEMSRYTWGSPLWTFHLHFYIKRNICVKVNAGTKHAQYPQHC